MGRRRQVPSLRIGRIEDHSTLGYVRRVWEASDGDATKRLYERLQAVGPSGVIALNLFRANKTSTRAKVYRKREHRGASYERKEWSISNAASVLIRLGEEAGIRWGWKEDPATPRFSWVIYVDTPTGQVSFHQATRGEGPDYAGDWDGANLSAERIVRWCADLLDGVSSERYEPLLQPEPGAIEPDYPELSL